MTTRTVIGRQMSRAVSIVAANPGCNKFFVAAQLHIGARLGTNCAYGYEPVNRAIRAGLIQTARNGNSYILTIA